MAKRNSFKKGTIELLTLAILQDGIAMDIRLHRVYAINPMALLQLQKERCIQYYID